MADTAAAAAADQQPHTYDFSIAMSCSGCSGAVERVIKKLPGIKSYDVSLDAQTASIVTDGATAAETPDYETIVTKIQKTGKKVNSARMDGHEMELEKPFGVKA
ncbi:MAG: hypothetical protein M1819_005051 [Sarea resinae]|nr:MAG: hypothetical protein M1819_005051 [Sarea resinae]